MKAFLTYCLSALAAVSLASPIIRGRDVTADELSSFRLFAQYAGATYCNSDNTPGQPVTCASGVCPDVEANNATTVASFGALVTDHRGFIAIDHTASVIVVSFRGTVSVRNWITDAIFMQTLCDLVPGCLVHSGFYAAWQEVSSAVLAGVKGASASFPSYRIVATGHSLGGATATLAAGYLRKAGLKAVVDLYTYGSPRVGNAVFAEFVTAQAQQSGSSNSEYRVTHANDPIARLPPIVFNYRHTSPEYWLTSESPVSGADVTVCEGHANTNCNGGTGDFNMDAHGWYFFKINGCATGVTPWKRDVEGKREEEEEQVTDKQIEDQLNRWVQMDVEFDAED